MLERLTEQGIVRVERTPAAVLYALNRRHLAADAVIALAELRRKLLTLLAEHLREWPIEPTYAALFGSAARGDMRIDSDVDLFLVRPSSIGVDDDQWRHQLDQLAADVTMWTGNDARILEYVAEEIAGLRQPADEPVETAGSVA